MKPNLIHSKDGRVTIYLIESKGEQFKGIARCNSTDEIKPEVGNKLAQYRAELAVHQRDLNEVRFAKTMAAEYMADLSESQSKLWGQWYQDACRVEKAHLKHIRNLKTKIKDLCND